MDRWRIHWTVGPKDLEGLSPLKARDILVQAFLATRAEVLSHPASQALDRLTPLEAATSAEAMVRGKFSDLGYEWEVPRDGEIAAVAEALAADAVAWGAPPEVVERYLGQIRSVEAARRSDELDMA